MASSEAYIRKRIRAVINGKKPLHNITVGPNTDEKADYLGWAASEVKDYFNGKPADPFGLSKAKLTANSKITYGNRMKRLSKHPDEFYGNGAAEDEETIQRRMILQDAFKDFFGKQNRVEYPVQAGGKGIDIVSTNDEGLTYCIELKAGQHSESVLKAALEINFYLTKILGEEHDPIFDNIRKIVLIPENSDAFAEFKMRGEELRSLFTEYLGPIEVVTYTIEQTTATFSNNSPSHKPNKYDPRHDFSYKFNRNSAYVFEKK